MAGTWVAQNKIRPGAYINFKSVPMPSTTLGNRGVGIICMATPWGAESELIEVFSSELIDGSSMAKIGVTAFDADALLLSLMLQNCYKTFVYRKNTGGVKASAIHGDMTVTAKYPGDFGNKIAVKVEKATQDGLYDVSTLVNGSRANAQRVADIKELVSNDYVEWSGEGAPAIAAAVYLENGTNGSSSSETIYPEYLKAARMASWQCMAVPEESDTIKQNILTFIRDMRENEGKKCQAVLNDFSADYEGIINSISGAVINGVTVSPTLFTAWVAGATAGAAINRSLTGKTVTGATSIIGKLQSSQIETALTEGKFLLATNQDGTIRVEDDINSLTIPGSDKNDDWKLNQFIRVIDEVAISINAMWERTYKGQVQNNEAQRNNFKSEISSYLYGVQGIEAIEGFGGAESITVEQGAAKYAVVCGFPIKPIVAMTHLYLTVNLS